MIRNTQNIPGDRGVRPAGWIVLLGFAVGTALLYLPVWWNGFLTDDYASLYRLLIEKRVLFEGMVRPLIDISFYFNYLISGLHPGSYYIFNLCVHALACYMVYRVALDLPLFAGRQQSIFALTAGFLFLFYPFHNEGVVWLSGRLPSMAALFGLMAIHFSLTKKWPWNFLLAAACWFVGLFAYESIIVLPGIVVLLEWIRFRDARRGLLSAGAWVIAGLLWLGLRYLAAGTLLPGYGKSGLAGEPVVRRMVKVLGRCFLPPEENSKLMMILFGVVMVLIGIVHIVMWARLRQGFGYLRRVVRRPKVGGQGQGWSYVALELSFLLALLPAIAFGVSTRTSEGDRLLYFPSCILCLLSGAVLLSLLPGRRWRLLLCGVYGVASVVFITGSNRRWVFASRVAEATLDMVRQAPGRLLLVNAPDEWEGAYIFRNSFKNGLVVNGIDTNKVAVTHFLTRLEYLRVEGRIGPLRRDSSLFIYPATRIVRSGDGFRVTGIADLFHVKEDRVYYWDKYEWKQLILN
jgi:hypothetical protein